MDKMKRMNIILIIMFAFTSTIQTSLSFCIGLADFTNVELTTPYATLVYFNLVVAIINIVIVTVWLALTALDYCTEKRRNRHGR